MFSAAEALGLVMAVLDGSHASQAGALPNAQHDAQAATLGANVYVFGGGQFTEYDHILSYSPSSAATSGRESAAERG